MQLRAQGPAGYQQAEDERCFNDKLTPPTLKEREELVRQQQEGTKSASAVQK